MKIKLLFSVIFIAIVSLMIVGSKLAYPIFVGFDRTVSNFGKMSAYKVTTDAYKNQQANILDSLKDYTSNTVIHDNKKSLSIPVIVYHGIVENIDDKENIMYERFFEQMTALKMAGYTTISHPDFNLFMKGKKELPNKSLLITFDDGRKDSYYPVDPILRALDFKATMFVISNRFEQSFHLSQNELKKMQKSGRWDIESHGHIDHDLIQIDEQGTKGHFLSNKMWLVDQNRFETDEEFSTRISKDLIFSKENLSNIFNKEVTGFAFPFGDYGQRSENYAQAEKVVSDAATSNYPLVYYQVWEGQGDIFNYPNPNATSTFVKRIKPTQEWTGEYLISFLEKSAAKELPIEDNFTKDIGWKRVWGSMFIENNELVLSSSATSTSAGVVLDGTQHFTDYILTADIKETNAKTVTIFGRYQDSNNYMSCIYGENLIKVEETMNGVKKTAFTGKIKLPTLEGLNLGVKSEGNVFGCTVNGALLAYTEYTHAKLNKGSLGFFVWNSENDAKLSITNVNIKK